MKNWLKDKVLTFSIITFLITTIVSSVLWFLNIWTEFVNWYFGIIVLLGVLLRILFLLNKKINIITMKSIEKIKFILGLILLSFPIIGGLIFFLEGFGVLFVLLDYNNLSDIFDKDTPIFLGLCGIGGSILLNSVKTEIK
jgi:hypothetical protein